jgi:MFS family permease
VPIVIGLRVLDRVGKGVRSPARDAMLAESVDAADRGRAFGFHRAFDHGGAVVGSLLAWACLSGGIAVTHVLALSAIPGAVMLVVLGWTLRRRGMAVRHEAPTAHATAGSTTTIYWSAVVMLALLLAVRVPETLLLLHLQQGGVSVVAVPLVWAGLHVVRSAAAYPAGRLVDAVGERAVIALSAILGAIGATGFALAGSVGWLVAAFIAVGLVAGVGEPAERTMVARLAPKGIGRAYGEAQGLIGVSALVAGLGYGMLYDLRGSTAALLTWAALAVLGTVAWLVVTRRTALAVRAQG